MNLLMKNYSGFSTDFNLFFCYMKDTLNVILFIINYSFLSQTQMFNLNYETI